VQSDRPCRYRQRWEVPLQAFRTPTSHACTHYQHSLPPSYLADPTTELLCILPLSCTTASLLILPTNTPHSCQAISVIPRRKAASPLPQHQYGQIVSPTSHLPPSVCLQHGKARQATPRRAHFTTGLAETCITHQDRRHTTWRAFTTAVNDKAVNKHWIAATHLAETP
jgi:hypothetical protein